MKMNQRLEGLKEVQSPTYKTTYTHTRTTTHPHRHAYTYTLFHLTHILLLMHKDIVCQYVKQNKKI